MLKNRLIYLTVLVYGIIFVILYNQYETFVIFIALLIIPVLLALMLSLTFPFIQVQILEKEIYVQKGEVGTIRFLVENHSFLPIAFGKINIKIQINGSNEKNRDSIEIYADARSSQPAELKMNCEHCGEIKIYCGRLMLYDYFKIFSAKKKVDQWISILVFPTMKELPLILPRQSQIISWENDVYHKEKPGNDPSEVMNIREYIPGDRIHRIHWKLSSKRNQYMVKEYSQPVNHFCTLAFDCYYQASFGSLYDVMDELLEFIISVSYSLILADMTHDILWYNKDTGEIERYLLRGEEDLYYVMGELVRVKPYEDNTLFPNALISFGWEEPANHIYYFGKADWKIFEELEIGLEVMELYEE